MKKTMWKLIVAGIALVIICSFGMASSFAVTFSDSTFNVADWSVTTLSLGNGGSATVSQTVSGGNPGAYCGYTHAVNIPSSTGDSEILVFHLYGNGTYDPSTQGAIGSIAYNEDTFVASDIGAGLALLQNGIFYYGGYRIDSNASWMSHGYSNLTAMDFRAAFSDLHPDFSSSGPSMTFGFMRANSLDPGFSSGYTPTWGGTDNWHVEITAVPEPANLSLFAIGTFAFLRKRNS